MKFGNLLKAATKLIPLVIQVVTVVAANKETLKDAKKVAKGKSDTNV